MSFRDVMEHVRFTQRAIAPADSRARLHELGVETYLGEATLDEGNVVTLQEGDARTCLRARHVLIATGSTPVVPTVPGIEHVTVVTTDSFWELCELPEQLLVVGGGPAGCELGQACARLGSTVTIVEASDALLSGEEPAASAAVARALRAAGVTVLTAERVEAFEAGHAVLGDGTRIRLDTCLMTVGCRAKVTRLFDPGESSIATDSAGHIVVDVHQRTSQRRVWAAGDVTGQLPLTSAAGLQGANAVLNGLLPMRRSFDASTVPRVTFTAPEVARVGMTASEARERFDDIEELVMPLAQVDRAVVTGDVAGELRLVTRGGRRLVGATWIGDGAGEQLALLGTVLGRRGSISALAGVQHGYPTLGEASRNAAFEQQLARAAPPLARRLLRRALPVLSRLS